MINLIAAMLVAAATPEAPAGSAATPPAAVQPAATPAPKSEKICWDETPTGTRFSHKVCATREQLDQRRRDDQDWKMGMRPQPASGR
jgi:hypothetical protein